MQHELQLVFNFTAEQVGRYHVLAAGSQKTLEEVHAAFHELLRETGEHPYKASLPEKARKLLTSVEAVPVIRCDLVSTDAAALIKGWLLFNALVLHRLNYLYEEMTVQA